MTDQFIVRNKVYEPTDPRLGRHVNHDSRSLRYLARGVRDPRTLTSVTHFSNIPTLDQGQLGSCTGNAATKCISYEPFWHTIVDSDTFDEAFAVELYSQATRIDPFSGQYPPTDTGSDGLSVAKVLKSVGLISGYQHATDLSSLLTTLSVQPVIVGTEWRTSMFDPDMTGRIKITGNVEGGHEYCLDALDVEHRVVWLQNSWGDEWGLYGRAYLTWDDMETLLLADGDCTIFSPLDVPAPTPTPVPVPDYQDEFVGAAYKWLSRKHWWSNNKAFERAVKRYLTFLGE